MLFRTNHEAAKMKVVKGKPNHFRNMRSLVRRLRQRPGMAPRFAPTIKEETAKLGEKDAAMGGTSAESSPTPRALPSAVLRAMGRRTIRSRTIEKPPAQGEGNRLKGEVPQTLPMFQYQYNPCSLLRLA